MNPTYGLCVRLFTASDDFASLCLHLPALLVRLAVGFPSLPLGPAAVKRQEKGEMKQPGFGTPTHNLTTSGGNMVGSVVLSVVAQALTWLCLVTKGQKKWLLCLLPFCWERRVGCERKHFGAFLPAKGALPHPGSPGVPSPTPPCQTLCGLPSSVPCKGICCLTGLGGTKQATSPLNT